MKHPLPLALLFSVSLLWPAAAQEADPPAEPTEAAAEGSDTGAEQAEGEAALHPACGLTAGAEQAVPPARGEDQQQLGEDNAELLAAAADMQRQLEAAVSQDNIDTAFGCALLAFHRGLAAMAGVHAEHGEEQAIKDAMQRFLTDIEDERQQLIQWLDQQE